MKVNHTAASCRWAVATLHMPAPVWLEAQDRPWTCLREPGPRPLLTTEACASCSRWESNGLRRRSFAADADEPPGRDS